METLQTTDYQPSYECPPGYIGREIKYFNMHDPRWEKKPYPYSDPNLAPGELGITGCVPTTIAEVASTVHNVSIYPDQVAEILAPAHTPNGTIVNKALEIVDDLYGLSLIDRLPKPDPPTLHKLIEYLKDEHIIMASFNKDSPFTNIDHVIIIRGISPDLTKFVVVDNNDTSKHEEGKLPNRNDREFNIADLPAWIKHGFWVVDKNPRLGY